MFKKNCNCGISHSFPHCLAIDTTQQQRACTPCVARVNSAREQDSSIGGGAGNVCLGVVHTEEEVQDRVQEEVGREEQGEGETHGKEQREEQRSDEKTINRSSWIA